jgi:DNA-binding transcriptional MerR regulator
MRPDAPLQRFITMPSQQPTRKRSAAAPKPPAQIPDKLYFRIGEVAKLCDVPAYVLRFWESEFPQLKPNKGGTGQRLYRRRDVESALHIKRLLYDEGYTIPGARQVFKEQQKQKSPELPFEPRGVSNLQADIRVQKLRKELHEILNMLSAPAPVTQLTASRFRPRLKPQAAQGPERELF